MEKHQRTHFKDKPDLKKRLEVKKTEEKNAKESLDDSDGGDFEQYADVSAVDDEIDVSQYLEMSM